MNKVCALLTTNFTVLASASESADSRNIHHYIIYIYLYLLYICFCRTEHLHILIHIANFVFIFILKKVITSTIMFYESYIYGTQSYHVKSLKYCYLRLILTSQFYFQTYFRIWAENIVLICKVLVSNIGLRSYINQQNLWPVRYLCQTSMHNEPFI